tara:strand:- start:164498 stop:164740 length:243 start_codon:yes stop_codon:yes gene_type:complete
VPQISQAYHCGTRLKVSQILIFSDCSTTYESKSKIRLILVITEIATLYFLPENLRVANKYFLPVSIWMEKVFVSFLLNFL